MNCSAPGCDKKVKSKGLCTGHYERNRKGLSLEKPLLVRGGGTLFKGYRMHSIERRKVFAHTLVAEKALGKRLPKEAVVHHVNGDKLDNRPENLVICPSHSYHGLIHARQDAYDACGHADWRVCNYCHKYDDPANMSGNVKKYHKRCAADYMAARRRSIANA